MNYKVINTGSDGNATVIEDFILIDCGISFTKLKEYYRNLKVVLLTHIHNDHFNKTTIKRLSKERPTLRFGCSEWLVEDLIKCGVEKKNIDVLGIGNKYDFGAFQVQAIQLYHDVENIGYRLFINDKRVLYMTDTNTLEGIEAKGYDLYLIEANYDEIEIEERIKNKLENNEYVYEHRARDSHLSKQQTDEFLLANMGGNSVFEYMHMHKEKVGD